MNGFQRTPFLIFFLLQTSCSPVFWSFFAVTEDLRKHPVRQMKYWQSNLADDLENRIYLANKDVLDFIKKDNLYSNIPTVPSVKRIKNDLFIDFMMLVQNAFFKIEMLREKLDKKLVGVVVMEGLGSSGYAVNIFNEKEEPIGCMIALDFFNLIRKANDWASWKANLPFEKGPQTIKIQIASEKQNTIEMAIQYLFLHEIGHCLAIGEPVHPKIGYDIESESELKKYWFFGESWDLLKKGPVSKFHKQFPESTGLKFYAKTPKKFANDRKLEFYRKLMNTNFPTLYSTTNFYEDFAESFVNYLHTIKFGNPFKISVVENEKTVFQTGHCWDELRCRNKRRLLEKYIFSKN